MMTTRHFTLLLLIIGINHLGAQEFVAMNSSKNTLVNAKTLQGHLTAYNQKSIMFQNDQFRFAGRLDHNLSYPKEDKGLQKSGTKGLLIGGGVGFILGGIWAMILNNRVGGGYFSPTNEERILILGGVMAIPGMFIGRADARKTYKQTHKQKREPKWLDPVYLMLSNQSNRTMNYVQAISKEANDLPKVNFGNDMFTGVIKQVEFSK
jgi:hypothetical protein